MRPIKFRAWDDKNKEWMLGYGTGSLTGFDMFGECMLFGEWTKALESRPLQELDTIVLMQFTGLTDKNGKEIYEGDVIERQWSDGGVKNHFVVRWDEDKTGWNISPQLLTATARGVRGQTATGFEVIGNIYENPELLKHD